MSSDDEAPNLTVLKYIDSFCARYEQAWKSGAEPSIEAYVAEAEPSARAALFAALLPLDHELRSASGQRPTLDDYRQRFPEYLALISSTLVGTETRADTKKQGSDPAPAGDSFPEVGEWIDEFEIKAVLGEGGFGKVYRAWQHKVDREVALKVTRMGGHETRMLAQLDGHPNIVRIYDFREIRDRGFHIVYMEFVCGVTVQSVIARMRDGSFVWRDDATWEDQLSQLDRGDALPTEAPGVTPAQADSGTPTRAFENWANQVCQVGAQLADALDYAHRRNVLHCDIKPANILLDTERKPKLVDFNVAHRTRLEADQIEGIGGTLPYMSPEQLAAYNDADADGQLEKAARLDGRCDLYSLAFVLWELLTGTKPYEDVTGDDWTSTLTALASQRRHLPSGKTPAVLPVNIPPALHHVLICCLSPDPDDRYASAGELTRELRLCSQTDVQALLYPLDWRSAILPWPRPLMMLVVIGLSASAVPSAINIAWNWEILSDSAQAGSAKDSFWNMYVWAINIPAYCLAAAIGIALSWPVICGLRAVQSGRSPQTSKIAIARCLELGHYVALVVLSSWVVASVLWGGLVFHSLGSETFDFSASVVVSGMIAAGLSFFSITFVCVRAFLPRLLRASRDPLPVSVHRYLDAYLGLLLLGWVLGIVLFVQLNVTQNFKTLLLYLVLLGAAGSVFAFFCWRAIRADLELLSRLALPPGPVSR